MKQDATQALEAMGLSVSDAVRVLLTRIAADQAFPFTLEVPNAKNQQAMREARSLTKARFSNQGDLLNALESE